MQIGLDITLLFQIVQFLIIVFIVNKLIVKPIHSTYSRRDDKIAALGAKMQANLNEIEGKKLEYEAKLQAVRGEITESHNQLKAEASARAQAIIDKAKAESQAVIDAKRTEIEKEITQARENLTQEITGLSQQIVTAVTK